MDIAAPLYRLSHYTVDWDRLSTNPNIGLDMDIGVRWRISHIFEVDVGVTNISAVFPHFLILSILF